MFKTIAEWVRLIFWISIALFLLTMGHPKHPLNTLVLPAGLEVSRVERFDD
jgi:hypothetical protein